MKLNFTKVRFKLQYSGHCAYLQIISVETEMCPRRGRVFAVVSAQVTPGDKADKIFARVEQPDTLAGGQCAQMLCLFTGQYRKFVISDKVKQNNASNSIFCMDVNHAF